MYHFVIFNIVYAVCVSDVKYKRYEQYERCERCVWAVCVWWLVSWCLKMRYQMG